MADIQLFDKQLETLNLLLDNHNGVSEVLYGGGARGGKTFLGCVWQIIRRLRYPGSTGMIARKDYTNLKATTMRRFWEVAALCGIKSQLIYHGGEDKFVEFPNGSIIFFRHCKFFPDDPEFDRFGSYDLTDFFGDEAQEYDVKFVNVIRGRLSQLTGKNADGTRWKVSPKSFFGCNPGKGFVYTDFWKPYKEGTLPPYRRFIRSLVDDNPFIEPEYIEQLMHSDRATIERLRFGNFDYLDDPNLLFGDYDALCDMFTNPVHPSRVLPSLAADIALKGRDNFSIFVDCGGIVTLEDLLGYSPADLVEKKIIEAQNRKRVPRSRMIADADGVGGFVGDYIKQMKEFHGNGTPLDRKYTNIKAQCYYKLAEKVNGRKIKVVGRDGQQLPPDVQEKIKNQLTAIKIEHPNDGKWGINSKEEQKALLGGESPDLGDTLAMLQYFDLQTPGRTTFGVGKI